MEEMEAALRNDVSKEEVQMNVDMSGEFVVHPNRLTPLSAFERVGESEDKEEDEEDGDEKDVGIRGEFVLHRGPICPFLVSFEEQENEGDQGDEDSAMESDKDITHTHAYFILSGAPDRPHLFNDGNRIAESFEGLGRAVEPERSSCTTSEVSAIRLDASTARPRAPFSERSDAQSPSTGVPSFTPATATIPGFALPSSLQKWRYRDAVLPNSLPKTIGQWAKLEHKVRMITPLPSTPKPEKVSEATVREVRRLFEKMWVRDQKKICEVVRKSWVMGADGGFDFLTGNEKKSQQIAWDNLSAQCVRNIKAIIEHMEYGDFDNELAEMESWKVEDEAFKAVKADDNFYGVGWELRGSRGQFSGTEDDLMYWHDKVWPKKLEADPGLVLMEAGPSEDQLATRMQLKDGDEGVKLKNQKKKKPAMKPKLGQARRGMLAGGQPGPWGFWTQPDDRHLRDVVLSSQGDAYGAA